MCLFTANLLRIISRLRARLCLLSGGLYLDFEVLQGGVVENGRIRMTIQ